MSRKMIVAGNWKMNQNLEEGKNLVNEILQLNPQLPENVQVIISPSFVNLANTAQQLQHKENFFVAAQNCHQEKSGAYTGEVSAAMAHSTGATHVILGHSERRQYFGENNALLAKKTDAALSEHLSVIFCVGETIDVREAGTQNNVVATQISEGLFHLDAGAFKNIIIAYEPVWAIGTGLTATAEQAQEMHAHIRSTLAAKYGADVAENVSILYGGSCKPSNAAELFAGKDVDGGLIGGAALSAEDFTGIIKAAV